MRFIRFIGYHLIVCLMIALAACGQASAAPTVLAEVSATPMITIAASSTPAVTPLPTAIPTADFTLQDIAGTWTRIDPERGQLFLIFDASGTYAASHGTPDDVVHEGEYSLEGRMFTFLSGWDCAPAEHTPGEYIIRLAGEGKYLLFEPYEDTCPDRPESLKGFRWERVVSNP